MLPAAPRRRLADDPAEAQQEPAAISRERELPWSRAKLFEGGERSGVGNPIAAGGHGQVVAAAFALLADAVRNPPHGWMIEEERFDRGLRQIHEIVTSPHVSQFMREQRFKLFDRKTGEH